MANLERVLAGAAESLYGDERWRANLTDAEAKIVLDWAMARLTARINAAKDEAGARTALKEEWSLLRPLLSAINSAAKKSGTLHLADAAAAVEPILTGNQPFSREEVLTLLVSLIQSAEDLRKKKPLKS